MGQVLVSNSNCKPKASTVQSSILRGTELAVVVEVSSEVLLIARKICAAVHLISAIIRKGFTISTGINGRYTRGK